ncbi:putative peptide chain release factor C12orf65-like protein, mitochondrial [Armadillidium vulgare]|nr:putative peptide chain release factor C12orf65-like protein, mitochondrial [Armadillidium vulgare]
MISSYNQKISVDKSNYPTIQEDDLQEKFVRGSGPGGQCVNKTLNAVFLKHLPTGIFIKCHDSRSLEANRKKARELLLNKLDNHYNGEMSIENQKKRIQEKKSLALERKREKRLLMKKAWKESEE